MGGKGPISGLLWIIMSINWILWAPIDRKWSNNFARRTTVNFEDNV